MSYSDFIHDEWSKLSLINAVYTWERLQQEFKAFEV